MARLVEQDIFKKIKDIEIPETLNTYIHKIYNFYQLNQTKVAPKESPSLHLGFWGFGVFQTEQNMQYTATSSHEDA